MAADVRALLMALQVKTPFGGMLPHCPFCGADLTHGAAEKHALGCLCLQVERSMDVVWRLEAAAAMGVPVPNPQTAPVPSWVPEGSFETPWVHHAGGVVRDAAGREVYLAYATELPEALHDGYAWRVAACVNLCAGQRTEDLESERAHVAVLSNAAEGSLVLQRQVCRKCGQSGGMWTAGVCSSVVVDFSLLGLNQCVVSAAREGSLPILYTHHCGQEGGAR
jgi:hypothetical protein